MQRQLNSLLARLLISSAIPVVLFVGVALVAGIVIYRLNDALHGEAHSRDVIRLALLERHQVDRMRLGLQLPPLARLPNNEETYDIARAEFLRLNAKLLDEVSNDPDQQRQRRTIEEREKAWHKVVTEHLTRPPPDPEEAVQVYHQKANPRIADLKIAIGDFISQEEAILSERREKTLQETWQGSWVIGLALFLAIALTGVLSYLMARSVSRPISSLIQANSDLLSGRHQLVPVSGPSEIARLIIHFNHMAVTLLDSTSLLQKQEERYRTYVAASSHILWTANVEGQVSGDLPSWQAFTGQTGEAVRGWGWFDAVHPEDRAAAMESWKASVGVCQPCEMEFRLRSAKGEYRDFSCRGVPILGVDGSLREWIGTCTDITERKRTAALLQARDAAESSSRAKSEFLTKMSHELRTPLNAVIGMSRMLLTQRFGRLNAKQIDYLRDITQSGEHLLALINDILDLSKVEAGKMDVQPETFRVADLVKALLSTLRPLAEGKGIVLTVGNSADGTLRTDPSRFRQILLNLLSNAIKFTSRDGKVNVAWQWLDSPEHDGTVVEESAAPAIRVVVEDTGIGIAAEDQHRVWEEFRQIKTTANQAQEGTGLGLALTRRLVRLLGGGVGLESEPGVGSKFTFVLPRQAPTQSASEPCADAKDRPLVLVVEDYPPTHKLLVDWLSNAGLATASAYDGEIGLEMARRLRPRLVVLDIHLPKRDGWQVLTELKSDPETATIPVVIMTVTEDRQPASALGVQEFFIKPVDRGQFLDRLRVVQPALFSPDRPTSILLVDDEPVARKLIGDLLRAEGLTVREATNGVEALEQLRQEMPAALVLDLLMPELDGFGVIDAIRANPAWQDLPILVITSKDLTPDDQHRINGSIQALMAKNLLTPDRLQAHLRDMGLLEQTL